jgi:DNA-binding CsgD family transcriptional regulator
VDGLLASSHGHEAESEAAFASALEQHARIAEPFERARTLHALGQSRRRFRRRGRAREALLEAVEVYEELGATIWRERSRAELERTGHREQGAALSATQQQIAELVVEGHTNREIAERLFMSPHTVEAHLTKIYRSLGIRGRAELARAIGARNEGGG